MAVRFRAAIEADSQALAALLGMLGHPTTVQEVENRLARIDADSLQSVIVVESESEVIAFASLTYVPFFHLGEVLCRVSAIAVDTGWQGKGIGRALMEEIENVARNSGCAGIELTSSLDRTEAHRFYARLGYEQSSLKFRKRLVDGSLPAREHSA